MLRISSYSFFSNYLPLRISVISPQLPSFSYVGHPLGPLQIVTSLFAAQLWNSLMTGVRTAVLFVVKYLVTKTKFSTFQVVNEFHVGVQKPWILWRESALKRVILRSSYQAETKNHVFCTEFQSTAFQLEVPRSWQARSSNAASVFPQLDKMHFLLWVMVE